MGKRGAGRELFVACLNMPHEQEVERRIQTWVYLAPKPVSFHLTLIISENPVRRPVTLESMVVSPNDLFGHPWHGRQVDFCLFAH